MALARQERGSSLRLHRRDASSTRRAAEPTATALDTPSGCFHSLTRTTLHNTGGNSFFSTSPILHIPLHPSHCISLFSDAALSVMSTMPQVHYPSIERQDLTQGQLGSFKFTPVDSTSYPTPSFEPRGEARRLWQARAQARARMRGGRDQKSALERGAWQQYSHRARSQSPNKFDQNDSSYASAMSQSTQPQTPDSLRDQTFFNEHVKQDLEDSRLRLGATGFRSAVRGNSPERGSIHYPERHNQVSHSPILPLIWKYLTDSV